MNNVFSLQEIFAGKILQVPDYQRGYAWEQRQLDELLEDLEFLAVGKDHYTGSLVLHKQTGSERDEEGQKHDVYHVVDGQQRLTTLVLLLDAIRARFEQAHATLSNGIAKSYIRFTDSNHQPAFKMRLNADSCDYFAHNVLGNKLGPQGPQIASHVRLRDSRDRCKCYLEDKERSLGTAFDAWLFQLYDKITQRLKVGQYLVSDSTEVGVIFEVMNNRGKPLSELEKVKNYLLYAASKLDLSNHNLEDEINSAWAEIFQRLMAAGLTTPDDEDRLLRAHWLMAYDPAPKNWSGSRSIKGRFHLRTDDHKTLLNELRAYVSSLQDCVLAFSEIYAPQLSGAFSAYSEKRRSEIRIWATKLPRNGVVSPFLPLLMAVRLRYPSDADTYLAALRLFEVFAFRVYRLERKRANAGQVRFFRLGFELFRGETTLEKISKEVRQTALTYSPEHSFFDRFKPLAENDFYHWSGIRYFLFEYEDYLGHGHDIKMRWEDLERSDPEKTIEHILPQTPSDSYWKDRFDLAACRRLLHHIGNLTLTFDNSVYGNRPFPEKRGGLDSTKSCYATSPMFMERSLASAFGDWAEADVVKRSEQIRDWALNRWHIESSDLPKNAEAIAEEEPSENELL